MCYLSFFGCSPIWWGYCFHIFAIMFSTLAFCMVRGLGI